MTRIDKPINIWGVTPGSSAFWTAFGLLIAGFFIGQFVSAFFIFGFMLSEGATVDELSDTRSMFTYLSQTQLLISQATYTLVFVFLTPWIYLKFIVKKSFRDLYKEVKLPALPILLTVFATLAFMAFNIYVIEWNAGVKLPGFLSGLEETLQDLEEQMAETTKAFTNFGTFGSFLLGFIVIAILPGIGEELMFRGVLQNSLHKYSGNKHLAIWVTAFIFSAIHMQFYGLVPRMMLGALFGYLYVWSGNLWLPIISHITNNGLVVFIVYRNQISDNPIDIDSSESIPVTWSIIGLVVCAGLLFLFRNHYLRAKSENEFLADGL